MSKPIGYDDLHSFSCKSIKEWATSRSTSRGTECPIFETNPCGEINLGDCKIIGEDNMIKIDDYVVYAKNGDLSTLKVNKKNIWKVISVHTRDRDIVTVKSILKDSTFETSLDNLRKIKFLESKDLFKREYFIDKAYDLYKERNFTGSKIMSNTAMYEKSMVSRTMDSNVEAAKVGATIAAGRTLNGVVAKQLVDRKVLPYMIRGYADTAFGAVVIANIADFAVNQFNIRNPKARLATEAMMQAAMVDLLAEVDFESIINEVLSNVALGEDAATD